VKNSDTISETEAQKLLVSVTVNGEKYERHTEPRRLLADFIREELGLKGTHVGCEHGVCGACTILVDGRAVRSCLLFAVQANGADITTVEGIARDGKLHPLQESFIEHHGLQCGFCTPGILLSALDFLREYPAPTEAQIREGISGSLCRCTGYAGIVDAILAGARKIAGTNL
jgi:aerobic-type carbon monoxide dehydrogenase small subunit (CoxS/CutS family)